MAKNKKSIEQKTETVAPTEEKTANSIFESKMFWQVGCVAVLLIAVALRFYDLPLVPFHHDEGVNGFFLTNLFRTGVYHYDPQNYHGPTLYFFTLAASYLFGLNDFAVRSVPALCGAACVAGILSLRRYLGNLGALAGALLAAISPGMVYISRYFIHELPFVLFAFGVPLAVVKFIERERASKIAVALVFVLLLVCLLPGTFNFADAVAIKPETRTIARIVFFALEAGIVFMLVRSLLNWNDGKPIYLLLAAASLALTFATKETAFISFGTMLIAFIAIRVWLKIWRGDEQRWASRSETPELSAANFGKQVGDSVDAVFVVALCLLIFAYVGALFFSSFFTYGEGVTGAFEAYAFWSKTGSKDHTQNGFWAYFKWLLQLEAPLLVLGAIGAVIAFWKAKHRFAMFAALWAWGLLAAYTLIPYKTPWLAVNFILPLCIIGGYAIGELARLKDSFGRKIAAFLATISVGTAAYQSIDLNFYSYDDNEKAYVYAHTVRDVYRLIYEVKRAAEISGEGKDASILIVAPEYWSLPWYFREYPGAAFYGSITPSTTAEIIIGSTEQAAELEREYGKHHSFAGTYTLRPGVELELFVRKDIADKINR
jgi:uncharacterized protein (TIGR03663 family)